MSIPLAVFFASFLILFYIYLGYPLVVLLLSVIKRNKVKKGDYQPKVTILIAAYNEEKVIEATIRNKLALDYPAEKMEILVVSDGSRDKTDDIVAALDSEVKLLRQEPRAGKTSALNMAVPHANGEIIVFSDANSIYESGALKQLLRNFHDPAVGYVTGKMIYTNPQGGVIGDGCTTYMKYENGMRLLETKIGSIVGVDGGIDAIRKSLYKPMNPDQLPDFVLPLKVIEQGYRVVYEPEAVLKEPALASIEDEYRMRVRVSLRAIWALHDMRHLFNPFRYRLFAWELFSHKWLRYLAFVFLLTAFASNLFLWNSHLLYKLLLICHTVFYLAALASFIMEKMGFKLKIFFVPYYFTLINLASAHAFVKYLMGQKQVLWTPRKG